MKAFSTSVMTALIVSIAACGGKKGSSDDGNQNPPVQSETKPAPEQNKDTDQKPKDNPSAPNTTNSPTTSNPPVSNPPSTPAKDVTVTGACRTSSGCNHYVFSGPSGDVSTLVDSYKQACASGTWANSCSAPYGACSVGVTGKAGSASVKTMIVIGTSVESVKQTCGFAGLPYVSSL